MKQLILLQAVDAGNGRRRLGLSTEDWHRLCADAGLNQVIVEVITGNPEDAAIRTYREHGSLTNPQINNWLLERNYPVNERILLFEVSIEEGVHRFKLLGQLLRNEE